MSSFNRGISTGNAKIDNKIKSLGKKNVSSTAGAIVTTNDKGETTMEKVKVKRYVAGKMPEFKPLKSPSKQTSSKTKNEQVINSNYYTIRDELKNQINEFTIDDQMNHEQIYTKNEIKVTYNRKSELTDDNTQPEVIRFNPEVLHHEEPNEDDAALRRRLIKEKLLAKQQQTTTKDKSQVDKETTKSPLDISEDEYEYYTSDEEETYSDDVGVTIPRLKPVFVRKEDRVTLHEPEVSTEISLTEAIDEKILAERRRESRRMVSSIRKEEMVDEQNVDTFDQVVITDDEDDEAEFEAWKLRELKRMKRDIEERQELENEKIELEKIRNMSEKERIKYFEQNPKFISNQAAKGTYKYLQKYYHRGAFFLDRDDEIFKRNFDAPTLEDHFDKSVLPDYLQIKNFGKVGRTKYTHLTDQDTTDHMLNRDEASANIPAFQQKLHSKISAGSKQIFEKPSHKRKRQIDD